MKRLETSFKNKLNKLWIKGHKQFLMHTSAVGVSCKKILYELYLYNKLIEWNSNI